jgi:ubiquitin-protein ligase
MTDKIFEAFLRRQYEQGMALARDSDLLELIALDGPPPQHYVARFRCKGLVRTDADDIVEAERFEVGIWFPDDYLCEAEPLKVLTWFGPRRVFHPNISDRAPVICVGRLAPGTPLVDILYQCFEIISYGKVTMREDDALNKEACAWARRNQHRFPIDSRPLKRRALDVSIENVEAGT